MSNIIGGSREAVNEMKSGKAGWISGGMFKGTV